VTIVTSFYCCGIDNIMRYFFPFTLYMAVCCSWGCKRPEEPDIPKLPFRTVMVYMAANNNLAPYAVENINSMESCIRDVDGTLLVYAKISGDPPAIYRIASDDSPQIKSGKLKTYPNHNSSDPEVMKMVFDDMQRASPAQTYGAVLWSHATGWIPALPRKLMSFGYDDGYGEDEREMNLKELKTALPSDLDFIIFDACSMASVEVLYELKDKTRYLIASPAEVISNGMPYALITNDLFRDGADAYIGIAQRYFQYYDRKEGLFRSATVSVFDMSHIDAVASASNALFVNHESPFPDLRRPYIQRMDFDRLYNPLIAFDFVDFVTQNFGQEATADLRDKLDSAILYKASTPTFNGYEVVVNGGVTCYIPHPDNELSVHDFYRQLSWYTHGGFHALF